MATKGWGRCVSCGGQLPNVLMRVKCEDCKEKDRRNAVLDRKATPAKLRSHPDLAELEAMVNGFYD